MLIVKSLTIDKLISFSVTGDFFFKMFRALYMNERKGVSGASVVTAYLGGKKATIKNVENVEMYI